MDIERVQELISQAKSLLIMLANYMQTTNQDDIAFNVIKVTQDILKEVEFELNEK